MSDAVFTKLPSPPKNIRKASIVSINNNEFVAIPLTKNKNAWGIYKYNAVVNSWMQFIKYPKNFKCGCHVVTFNPQNQILYIAESKKKQLITVDINSHKFETFPYPSDMSNVFDPDWPCLVSANDTVHLIGGNKNRHHYEWKIKLKSWTKIHKFRAHDIRAAFSIFIPSKQLILLVGGFDSGNTRYIIQTYSLLDKTWKAHVSVKCPIVHHGMVLAYTSSSLNECDVIILGSKPSDLKYSETSSTFILNINNSNKLKLIESNICCPVNLRNGQAVIVGEKNERLVEGYITQLAKIKNVPASIIQLIAEWYDRQILHWLGCCNKVDFHWSVPVDCILSNSANSEINQKKL
eukprot:516612_1